MGMISETQMCKKKTLNCFPIISISSFIYLIKNLIKPILNTFNPFNDVSVLLDLKLVTDFPYSPSFFAGLILSSWLRWATECNGYKWAFEPTVSALKTNLSAYWLCSLGAADWVPRERTMRYGMFAKECPWDQYLWRDKKGAGVDRGSCDAGPVTALANLRS